MLANKIRGDCNVVLDMMLVLKKPFNLQNQKKKQSKFDLSHKST